ncbi:delta-12 fatty acid desaturase [Flagelloscypha sp. PMI_526]|nr:delta-12 fatty acid desaturase [Flagelloscypha sp. PMI_526]
MFSLQDSPEYIARKNRPFSPPKVTLAQLRASVPPHLFQKNTKMGFFYAFRDLAFVLVVYKLGWQIEPVCTWLTLIGTSPILVSIVRATLWVTYWIFQGISMTSCWCLAHEASHGTLSPRGWVNHLIGFPYHTFLFVPYFAWRSSHHAHHRAVTSVERDENYVPPTRTRKGLPAKLLAKAEDYHEMLEETPIVCFTKIVAMQLFGLALYFLINMKGSPRYPFGTNHYSPYSSLFRPIEFWYIIASDVGLLAVIWVLREWTKVYGFSALCNFYVVPWMLTNHWIVLLTYLHHTDPTVPYYRASQWSFVRGAIATVDRPLFGWIGSYFFHNVSHTHVSHHLFSHAPFYNQPAITQAIKPLLGESYNYDSTPIYRALYRTFTECEFIEEDEEIVFYKNRKGEAARVLAPDALDSPPSSIAG